MTKKLLANAGDAGSTPGQEDPLAKEMVIHSSVLAWKISWTEEPSGIQSMMSQRVRHSLVTKHAHTQKMKGCEGVLEGNMIFASTTAIILILVPVTCMISE